MRYKLSIYTRTSDGLHLEYDVPLPRVNEEDAVREAKRLSRLLNSDCVVSIYRITNEYIGYYIDGETA